jgi:hypothetical protein
VILAVLLALVAVGLLAGGSSLRLPALAGAGLLMLGVAEATVLVDLHGLARALGAVPAAALLLGAGELCFDLADGVRGGADTGGGGVGGRRRQVARLCGPAVGGAAVAFVVLGAEAIPLRRSAVVTIAGAALAAFALWLLITTVHARVGED